MIEFFFQVKQQPRPKAVLPERLAPWRAEQGPGAAGISDTPRESGGLQRRRRNSMVASISQFRLLRSSWRDAGRDNRPPLLSIRQKDHPARIARSCPK